MPDSLARSLRWPWWASDTHMGRGNAGSGEAKYSNGHMSVLLQPCLGGLVARQAPVLAHYNAMHANSFDSGDCASLGKPGEAGFVFKTGS